MYKLFLFIFIFLSVAAFPQQYSYASKTFRNDFESGIKSHVDDFKFKSLDSKNEQEWKKFFWSIELLQLKTRETNSILKNVFKNVKNYGNTEILRSYIEVVYSLFPNDFQEELFYILNNNHDNKIKAMCVNYLLRCNYKNLGTDYYIGIIESIKDYKNDPILFSLYTEIKVNKNHTPSIASLLKIQPISNLPVVFSFQRHNRRYPGLLVIKDKDNKFIKDKSGEYFNVGQLANSMSDLPGYITNGNSPQGIFSIQSIDTSSNWFIGPTQALVTVLPYEVNYSQFIFDSTKKSFYWNINLYKELLPVEWRDYFPILEAFYAGKAGRSEIIAHGTTVNPEYYNKLKCYPYTPSMGCLTTKELWDENGNLISSDQVKLISTFKNLGSKNGFLVVIELDDKNEPVTINDIEKYLEEYEKH